MTQSKLSGWKMSWYQAQVVIGCDLREKSWEALRDVLAVAPWPDARQVRTEPAASGGAMVTITMRARHAGDAACKAVEFLRQSAPREWDWASAEVQEASRVREGIKRWPLLAVQPASGEAASASAALWLAGHAANAGNPAEVAVEVLRMCGLTLSAGGDGA
jgi:hypothetical protein